MATALRPVAHDARLSLVEHLDELRTRIIICVTVLVAAFGVCFWQNDVILDVINKPLADTAFSENSADPFEQAAGFQQAQKDLYLQEALVFRELAQDDSLTPQLRGMLNRVANTAEATAEAAPRAGPRRPVTLGVGEPFTATVRVAAYAALLLALPLLLYQMYAFVLPAFSPREKQVALPLMAAVPFLFVGGVVFAYYFVLPAAVDFLQNFNDDNYDILLQARDYYKFALMLLMVMGFLFQIPILILAITRMGIMSVAQLRKNRRYAILIIAVMAMLLPGQDPVTMLLMMAPLIVLFEGSILFAAMLDRRAARVAAREEAQLAATGTGGSLDDDRDDD